MLTPRLNYWNIFFFKVAEIVKGSVNLNWYKSNCVGITVYFCNETLYISTSFFEPSVFTFVIRMDVLSTVKIKVCILMMQFWAFKKSIPSKNESAISPTVTSYLCSVGLHLRLTCSAILPLLMLCLPATLIWFFFWSRGFGFKPSKVHNSLQFFGQRYLWQHREFCCKVQGT